MNNEELFQIIRKFGYTTKGQTDEIADAIIDAQRAASQQESERNTVLEEAASAIENLDAWCGGHGEPSMPSSAEHAKKIRNLKS